MQQVDILNDKVTYILIFLILRIDYILGTFFDILEQFGPLDSEVISVNLYILNHLGIHIN